MIDRYLAELCSFALYEQGAALDQDTVWLSLNQIAQLFIRDKSFISRYLRNIYKEGALSQTTTVAKNATVQIAASRNFLRGAFMFQQSEKEWDVLQSQKKVGGAQYDLPLILSTVSSIPVLDIKSYGQKTPIGVECE